MKNKEIIKQQKQERRHQRVRAKIKGTADCPRLSVFRSNQNMYIQIIDDEASRTLTSAYSKELKIKKSEVDDKQGEKIKIGLALGKLVAERALAKKIKRVVFDRGGHKYHGRIKAVADGAREAGLKF